LLQKGEEKSQKIRRAMAILAAQSTLLFFYSSLRDLGTEIDLSVEEIGGYSRGRR